MIFINNGKYGGGRNVINSHGVINDGLVEVEVLRNVTTLLEIKKLFDKITKKGGIHVYHPKYHCYRGKTVRVVNRTFKRGDLKKQICEVDGEDVYFTEYAKYEVLPGALEVVVDFDRMLSESKYLV